MKKVAIFFVIILALTGCGKTAPNKNINNETLTKDNVNTANSAVSSIIEEKQTTKIANENKNVQIRSSKNQPIKDDDLQLSNYKLHMTIDKFEKDIQKNLKEKSSSYDNALKMTEKTFEFKDGTIFFFR